MTKFVPLTLLLAVASAIKVTSGVVSDHAPVGAVKGLREDKEIEIDDVDNADETALDEDEDDASLDDDSEEEEDEDEEESLAEQQGKKGKKKKGKKGGDTGEGK